MATNRFVALILILTLLSQARKSTHTLYIIYIYMIPLKGVMHLFEVSGPFNMCGSFQMVDHSIEVGHGDMSTSMAKMNPLAHAMPFSQ